MEAMTLQGAQGRSTLRLLAIVGGALLVAQAIAAALTDQNESYSGSTGDVLADALLAAGLLFTLAGLEALRHELARRLALLAMAGQLAIVVAVGATVAAGREALDVVFVVGALGWLAGLSGLAVAALRSHHARWRPGMALPMAGIAALALSDAGGAVLLGLVWLVLSFRLPNS